MRVKFINDVSNHGRVVREFKEFVKSDEIVSVMLLLADRNTFSHQELTEFTRCYKPIFGGIFPQVVFESKNYDSGLLLIGLTEEVEIKIIENLSCPTTDFETQHDFKIVDDGYKTMLVFVDGFSKRIGSFIESLFNIYGIELNFIGGGAGSLTMIQKPCIFTNNGLLKDAAVMAVLKSNSGIGVKHGWEVLAGPFKVSHSEGNTILKLENKSAFDIYKQVIEDDLGKAFDCDNFFEIAKAYPFGISKIGTEKIVRDPILKQDDGSLVCVGEVPQNAFVHILKGKPENLVRASHSAYEEAKANLKSSNSTGDIFLIDCISRVLFLENDFSKELAAIGGSEKFAFGALTLGEIANSGKDYLEFYNKTAVVAIIEKL